MSTVRPEGGVAAAVVTYHSGDVQRLVSALSEQCDHVIIVDNGSSRAEVDALRQTCTESGALLVTLGRNTGIAAAQNRGIEVARELGAQQVLLSDDDSAPEPGMVTRLLEGLELAQRSGPVAAVGPLIEEGDGADELIYVARTWGPRRANRSETRVELAPVAFLVASGCLLSLDALDLVGPMNESLFIDHVDLEWGLRARRAGLGLFVVTRARMSHSLGDRMVTIPGRRQPVHVHSATRNYYLVRNTTWLLRSALLPMRWRLGYVWWMLKYVGFNVLVNPPRAQRLNAALQGVRDGALGRMGPRHERRA